MAHSNLTSSRAYFSPENLTVLGDVFTQAKLALEQSGGLATAEACDALATRIFTLAARGDVNPGDMLNLVLIGLTPNAPAFPHTHNGSGK